MPTGTAELALLRKGDGRKAMLAALLRRGTTVGFEWIGIRLQMGRAGSVSRLVCHVKRKRKLEKVSMNWEICPNAETLDNDVVAHRKSTGGEADLGMQE